MGLTLYDALNPKVAQKPDLNITPCRRVYSIFGLSLYYGASFRQIFAPQFGGFDALLNACPKRDETQRGYEKIGTRIERADACELIGMGDQFPEKEVLNFLSAFGYSPWLLPFCFTGLVSKCAKYLGNELVRLV